MRDRLGLPLTTASRDAAVLYMEGVDRLLAGWPGADNFFERAAQADPGFALPRIARARFLQTYGRLAEARAESAQARSLVQSATRRERQHVEAIGLAIDGDAARALDAVLQHTSEFPRDALVLSLALGAFGLLAFSGRADHDATRLGLLRGLSAHYGEHWWFLTHLGWSHTEAGELEAGQRVTARALELRRENAHGAHAMAHSFHERGEHAAGRAFVEDWLACYDRTGAMHCHLSWHLALFALEQGDAARALALYADCIRPAVATAPPINVLTDGVGLLHRLSSFSKEELPWAEQLDYAKKMYPRAGNGFIDTHFAIAAAGAGDFAALEGRLNEARQLQAAGKLPAGEVVPALCEAALAYSLKDFARMKRVLDPFRDDFARLGGSRAQREMYEALLAKARRAP